MGEGHGLEPRDWTVQRGNQPLTFLSYWYRQCLGLKKLLRLHVVGDLSGESGTCRLEGPIGIVVECPSIGVLCTCRLEEL